MGVPIRLCASALAVVLVIPPIASARPPQRVNALAATLKSFQDKVHDYLDLRNQLEAKTGPLPETKDPAEISKRQHALGEAIRAARADAKQGDIFTRDVATVFRRLIARDLARRRPVDRRALVVSQPDIAIHVNDFYPTNVPLGTTPPQMLKKLPQLPDGLEYRFVGEDMILRDRDPNLIVDILRGAVPLRYRAR